MNKILVLRYGTIGDSIFASAFYRELRKALPNAQIDILVDNIAEQVMKFCPYINNIHLINGKFKNIKNYISLFKKYDTVYFLKNDSFFSIVAFLARVKTRIGFKLFRNKFLTTKIPYDLKKHEIDSYLDLLKISNIPTNNCQTEIWISPESLQKIEADIDKKSTLKVCIQAYSRFPQKNWLNEHWIDVIEYLTNTCQARVYFIGSEKDKIQYEELTEKLKDTTKYSPINMCGKYSIQDSMAFISKMDLLIGIDSGLSHVAAALNVPQIWLHGSTSLLRWKPRSERCIVASENFKCSPCCLEPNSKNLCKNTIPQCMEALSSQKVINAIKSILP